MIIAIDSNGDIQFCHIAQDVHDVTILFLDKSAEHGDLQQWASAFRAQSLRFEVLLQESLADDDISVIAAMPMSQRALVSYRLMRWLLRHEAVYTAVVVHDWLGAGYYPMVRCSDTRL